MFLFLLVIPFLINLSTEIDPSESQEQCDLYQKDFMRQFRKAVWGMRLYQELADRLSVKCHRVMNCSSQFKITFEGTPDNLNFSSNICQLLDLYKGPLGYCFDYIRYESDLTQLMDSVLKDIDTKNVTSDTPYFGKKDDRPVLMTFSCQSIFSSDALLLMKQKCDPDALLILNNNTDFLHSVNCTGVEHYNWMMWNINVDIKRAGSY